VRRLLRNQATTNSTGTQAPNSTTANTASQSIVPGSATAADVKYAHAALWRITSD
jgi:hypothetical protein